jgi:glycosyltransferase involved in cell wall biosynthesis
MRLLAIIEGYNITGPAKNLIEFGRYASQQGVELTIATFIRGSDSNLFIESVRTSEIPVETIRERGAGDFGVFRQLSDVVGRVNPDVIQTHAVKSHFLARAAGFERRAPWVAFHHGYTWPAFRARLYNQLDRWSLRAAHKVLTVSRPFRDELVARGVRPERIEIVHNSIRPDWGRAKGDAEELRRSLGIAPQRKVALAVGRLSREKDHITLVRALAEVKDCHLLMVGEGPERSRIEKEIARLKMGPKTTLAGQQSSAESFYAIADLAVLSSVTEGSSNALLEAMAAGVPVVATSVGGTPEIVKHERSALLVKPANADEMRAAIVRLLGDEPLRRQLIREARELIEQRHAPAVRARRLVEIYQEVVANGIEH